VNGAHKNFHLPFNNKFQLGLSSGGFAPAEFNPTNGKLFAFLPRTIFREAPEIGSAWAGKDREWAVKSFNLIFVEHKSSSRKLLITFVKKKYIFIIRIG
jgi:hypothetical protein